MLVTGAAGSIGSEICRQVAACGPASLVLADINENNLYMLYRSLQRHHPALKLVSEVVDIRDAERLIQLGREHRPERVLHAAAHKHVPLMERNPEEAIKNNVLGCRNVVRMAEAVGAERFVFISTDKAVEPASVMGASKQIAEMLVRHHDRRSSTRFTVVRFGNVLGSAGSVVPDLQAADRARRPCHRHAPGLHALPDDHPRGGRARADGRASAGDDDLYVLEMGEPIRILDLARLMITLAGQVPEQRDPDRLHRPAPRREAARTPDDGGRGEDRASRSAMGFARSTARRRAPTSRSASTSSARPRRGGPAAHQGPAERPGARLLTVGSGRGSWDAGDGPIVGLAVIRGGHGFVLDGRAGRVVPAARRYPRAARRLGRRWGRLDDDLADLQPHLAGPIPESDGLPGPEPVDLKREDDWAGRIERDTQLLPGLVGQHHRGRVAPVREDRHRDRSLRGSRPAARSGSTAVEPGAPITAIDARGPAQRARRPSNEGAAHKFSSRSGTDDEDVGANRVTPKSRPSIEPRLLGLQSRSTSTVSGIEPTPGTHSPKPTSFGGGPSGASGR